MAYLVAGLERPALATLKQGLLRELPDYMVPARFVFLDAMPLSPDGKVDRTALPGIVNHRPELAQMYLAPGTPLQRELCAIWRQILDLDRVGIRDNFFDLGGNSLQVLTLAAALSGKLGREIPAVKLFQCPSVEMQAQGERKSRSIASLGESADPTRDVAALTSALGRLSASGVTVDWNVYRGAGADWCPPRSWISAMSTAVTWTWCRRSTRARPPSASLQDWRRCVPGRRRTKTNTRTSRNGDFPRDPAVN